MRTGWKDPKLSASVLAIAAACYWAAPVVRAAEWHIDTVDQSGSGQFTSLKIDTFGNLHVAYIPDVDGHPLKYAFWDHQLKRWFTMTVTHIASFCTLTLDSKQRPHISFADHGTGLGAKLRHAWWNGEAWHIDPITVQAGSVVAYFTSIVLDRNDNPILSYYDYADPGGNFRLRMRTVFWRESHWEALTVDPQGGSGKFNCLAMDSAGHPHLAYANVRYESAGLRYAVWDGQAWKKEIVEAGTVFSVSMTLDKNDNPHIAYIQPEKRLVEYATQLGGKWKTEVVNEIRKEAYPDRNGIAVDSHGTPYISYFDAGVGTLNLAYRKNGKWWREVIDQNYAGLTSSIAIDHDTIWISYADELGGALKVASRPLEQSALSVEQNSVPVSKVK